MAKLEPTIREEESLSGIGSTLTSSDNLRIPEPVGTQKAAQIWFTLRMDCKVLTDEPDMK